MDERLIEAVREFTCIWQLSSRSYKHIRAKENAWKAVAAKVLSIVHSSVKVTQLMIV